MASPNAFGNQPTDSLIHQRNSAFRSTSPAVRSPGDPIQEKIAPVISEKILERDARDKRIIEGIEWTLKVLTIAAACVFGAWAPLSYKATLDGNSGNNAAQKSVVQAQKSVVHAAVALSSQARDAASQQSVAASHQSVLASKQSSALDHMNSRIEAIGQLWLYDFCVSRTNYGPCETFTSGFPISSLVNYLGATTEATTTSVATGITTSSVSGSVSSSSGIPAGARNSVSSSVAATGTSGSGTSEDNMETSGSNLAMPAILGIVFGVLTAIGLILGIWLFRMKRRSHTSVYQ